MITNIIFCVTGIFSLKMALVFLICKEKSRLRTLMLWDFGICAYVCFFWALFYAENISYAWAKGVLTILPMAISKAVSVKYFNEKYCK